MKLDSVAVALGQWRGHFRHTLDVVVAAAAAWP